MSQQLNGTTSLNLLARNMRFFLLPLLLICLGVAYSVWECFTLARCGPRWAAIAYACVAVVAHLLLVAAIMLIVKEPGQRQMRTAMWLFLVYFLVYIPAYLGLIVKLVGAIPFLFTHGATPGYVKVTGNCVSAAIALAMLWGTFVTRTSVKVREVTLEFANLPQQFDGYRIAQFSDLHLGSYAPNSTFIKKLVDRINGLDADLICFTGDVVNTLTEEAYPFKEALSGLHAPDGVLSILGNHDYGDYYRWPTTSAHLDNNRRLLELEREMGWTMLNNADTLITRGDGSIYVIGVENWGEPPFPQYGRLAKAHPDLNGSGFKILLSHNPKHWRGEVLGLSNIDLTLSGHTHAMQFEISFFGHRWSIASLKYKEWGGLYQENGQMLYVNTGIGEVGVPMRIGATPEVTLFTLKQKN